MPGYSPPPTSALQSSYLECPNLAWVSHFRPFSTVCPFSLLKSETALPLPFGMGWSGDAGVDRHYLLSTTDQNLCPLKSSGMGELLILILLADSGGC